MEQPPVGTKYNYIPTARDATDEQGQEDDKAVVWAFLWTLFAFKMATVFLIYWASQSFESGAILTATTWPWLILPAAACASPLMFRYRLLRVRAKRERLRQSEWMLDGEPGTGRGRGRGPDQNRDTDLGPSQAVTRG